MNGKLLKRVETESRHPFRFLTSVLWEKKALFVRILTALLLLSICQASFVVLTGSLFNAILSDLSSPELTLQRFLPESFSHYFPQLANMTLARDTLVRALPAAILVVGILQGLASYLYQFNQQSLALHLANRFRDRLFSAVIHQPFSVLLSRSTGEWLSLIMNDVAYLQGRIADFVTAAVKDSSLILAALFALYLIHWPTAVFINLLIIPIMFGMGKTGRRISGFTEGWQRSLANMVASVLDLRRRFEYIRAQGGEALERKRFARLNENYFAMISKSILTRSVFAPGLELLGFVVFALILLAVAKGHLGAGFKTGELLQFFAALAIMLRPLKSLGEQITRYHETKAMLRLSFQTLANIESDADQFVLETEGSIERLSISEMRLRYKQDQDFELCARGLELSRGESVAIIGPSGGGKSTLIKCLGGLFKPDIWESNLTLPSLKSRSVLISQSPFLFTGSIRDNLVYGRAETLSSDDDLWDSLDFVGLKNEMIEKGRTLDSLLDFMQSPLSGGQMQRLTIARGLLRNKAIVLMDEVTSAIDPAAEEALVRRILEITKKKRQLLLFVTHRLSQLELFDQVWFCENGQVTIYKDRKEWQKSDRVQRFLLQES